MSYAKGPRGGETPRLVPRQFNLDPACVSAVYAYIRLSSRKSYIATIKQRQLRDLNELMSCDARVEVDATTAAASSVRVRNFLTRTRRSVGPACRISPLSLGCFVPFGLADHRYDHVR